MEFHFLCCSQKTIHTTPGSTPPRGLSALLKQLSVKSSVVFGCYGTSHHVTFKSMTIIKYCHTDQKQGVWIKPAFAAPFTGGKVLMCVVDQDRDEGKKKNLCMTHKSHILFTELQHSDSLRVTHWITWLPRKTLTVSAALRETQRGRKPLSGPIVSVGEADSHLWLQEPKPPNPASSSLVLMILH